MAPGCTPFSPSVFYVGNREISVALHSFLNEIGDCSVKVKTDPAMELFPKTKIHWGRDSFVLRLDGSYLVPYSIKKNHILLSFQLATLHTRLSDDFIQKNINIHGKGIDSCYAERIKAFALKKKISYAQGKTAIEGGNCFLFLDQKNEPKAIVGQYSIALSFVALEEQGYFQEEGNLLWQEIRGKLSGASEKSLQIARNYRQNELFRPFLDRLIENEILLEQIDLTLPGALFEKWTYEAISEEMRVLRQVLYNSFSDPLSDEERNDPWIREKALDLQAQMELTKNLIAQELGLSIENCAFVPQTHFHIDLDLCIGPDATVYVHSELEVMNAFLYERAMITKSDPLIQEYVSAASKRVAAQGEISTEVARILEGLGLRVLFVPGSFEAEGKFKVNFMNACFFPSSKGWKMVTGGTETDSEIETVFRERMALLDPALSVHFFKGASPPRTMTNILSFFSGGLHCITWPKGITDTLSI